MNIRERAGQGRYPAVDGYEQGRYPMGEGNDAARRPAPVSLRRSRRGWWIAGGVAVCWLGAYDQTGSLLGATLVLAVLAGLGWAAVRGLRAMGITMDHPALRRLSTRPWRNGRSVLNVAVRHLDEVLIVTPSGSRIAPDIVELQMNPGDLGSVRAWMALDVVSASLTEAYEKHVAKRGARFAGSAQPEVYLVPDNSVPQGRYQLRRGLPASARYAQEYWDEQPAAAEYEHRPHGYSPQYADEPDRYSPPYEDEADDSGYLDLPDAPDYPDRRFAEVPEASPATRLDPVSAKPDRRIGPAAAPSRPAVDPGRTVMDGMATIVEQIRPAVPVLRLVTGSLVAETAKSGARAGRGAVELELPDVPTVSRVHATFTFASGCWWVANEGVNGLSVNGVQVSDKHALKDGDSIRWGKRSDAPVSEVEIG